MPFGLAYAIHPHSLLRQAPGKPFQHPDYTGPEAYVRYFLPENYHVRPGRESN